MKKPMIITLIVAAVLLILAATCVYTVSEKDFAVITRFGKPVRTVSASGPGIKRPGFLETVNRIDRRTQVMTARPIQLLLGDKNPLVVQCFLCWRVKDPLLFFQSLANNEIASQKLEDMLISQLGGVLGNFTLENVINTDPGQVKLGEIEKAVLENTDKGAREKYGIEVLAVGIRNLSYPSVVARAVHNRMRSEREKESIKIRAQGQEEAVKIKARADRAATEIMAQAYKDAQIIQGQGEQAALAAYAEAYGKDQGFFEFMQSMELYKKIIGDKTTLILSTDSDLLRFLEDPQGGRHGQ